MDENENVWKNRVMYLKEGSVFEANEYKAYYGQCPVIKETQGKKIRQNGLAFPVFGSFEGLK
jgi:CRISPR-associated protein Csm4